MVCAARNRARWRDGCEQSQRPSRRRRTPRCAIHRARCRCPCRSRIPAVAGRASAPAAARPTPAARAGARRRRPPNAPQSTRRVRRPRGRSRRAKLDHRRVVRRQIRRRAPRGRKRGSSARRRPKPRFPMYVGVPAKSSAPSNAEPHVTFWRCARSRRELWAAVGQARGPSERSRSVHSSVFTLASQLSPADAPVSSHRAPCCSTA